MKLTGLAIDRSATAALVAIVIGGIVTLLTTAGQPGNPLEGAWWLPAATGVLTALAAFVRRQFDVPEGE